MVILNVIIDKKDNIENIKDLLKIKGVSIINTTYKDINILEVSCDDKLYSKKTHNAVIERFCKIIYFNIIEEYSSHGYRFADSIYDSLENKYSYLERCDISYIEKGFLYTLKGEDETIDKKEIVKIKSILKEIKSCINKDEFNTIGFIRFRKNNVLNKAKKIIPNIADKVVNNYLKDKNYKESIQTLKFSIETKECKAQKIILTIKENEYLINDLEGNDLYKKYIPIYFDENELNNFTKEQLYTFVITIIAPQNIIIYNKDKCKDVEFLRRIEDVFEDKVKYCM